MLDTSRQLSGKHNMYKSMEDTKPTHVQGASNFQCNELIICYRKEEHWKYNKIMIIQMAWLDNNN